jgi:hypothetical protein
MRGQSGVTTLKVSCHDVNNSHRFNRDSLDFAEYIRLRCSCSSAKKAEGSVRIVYDTWRKIILERKFQEDTHEYV